LHYSVSLAISGLPVNSRNEALTEPPVLTDEELPELEFAEDFSRDREYLGKVSVDDSGICIFRDLVNRNKTLRSDQLEPA